MTTPRATEEVQAVRTSLLTEHDLQASVIAECNLRANQDPRWGMIFAIPNGGLRSKATAGKLKAEGVKAGVPDLFLPVVKHGSLGILYYGLFMELKIGRNVPTGEQEAWLRLLREQGYYTCWIYDDPYSAIDLLRWYLDGEV